MFARAVDSDIFYSFRRRPGVIVAFLLVTLIVVAAVLAPWVAPHNPFDLRTLNPMPQITRKTAIIPPPVDLELLQDLEREHIRRDELHE